MKAGYWLLITLVLLAGCDARHDNLEEAWTDGTPILLTAASSSSTQVTTRAPLSGELLPANLEIGIFALESEGTEHPASWTASDWFTDLNNRKYISQQPSTETTPLNTADSQKVLFPSEEAARLWLYGYYPYNEQVTFNSSGHPCVPFELQQATVKDTPDYLYADMKEVKRGDNPVTLNFNHALARLRFKIDTEDNSYTEKQCPKVTRIKITTNDYQKGKMDVMTGKFTTESTANKTFEWKLDTEYKIYKAQKETPDADFLLIPSTNAILSMTMYVKGPGSDEETEVPLYDYINIANAISLEAGKITTVTIHYNIRISFSYSITKWGDQYNEYNYNVDQQ